ncbi:MAG TPA: DUF4040 domain-containing protein, partial [Candidatus Omnitrophota bacterium]|nr:DUF4040 domain-containing protein [Candidatus Omnitrophota bacterium]
DEGVEEKDPLEGAGLFRVRDAVGRVQATFPALPAADDAYRSALRLLDSLAVEVTARAQRGSLASSLSSILGVFVVLVGGSLLLVPAWSVPVAAWDSPAQAAVGLIVCGAAVALTRVRGRVRAVLTLGVTGYGTALLFLLHGAPDLALTQVLVETLTLVLFLLVMRALPKYFTDRPLHSSRWWRTLLAVAVGGTVTASILLTGGSRTAVPASAGLETAAYEFGYGRNIVNVILVDTRAWDTLGEVSVLVVAATGVASLIFLRSRTPISCRVRGYFALNSPVSRPAMLSSVFFLSFSISDAETYVLASVLNVELISRSCRVWALTPAGNSRDEMQKTVMIKVFAVIVMR